MKTPLALALVASIALPTAAHAQGFTGGEVTLTFGSTSLPSDIYGLSGRFGWELGGLRLQFDARTRAEYFPATGATATRTLATLHAGYQVSDVLTLGGFVRGGDVGSSVRGVGIEAMADLGAFRAELFHEYSRLGTTSETSTSQVALAYDFAGGFGLSTYYRYRNYHTGAILPQEWVGIGAGYRFDNMPLRVDVLYEKNIGSPAPEISLNLSYQIGAGSDGLFGSRD